MPFSSGASLILGGARSGKSAFAEALIDESQREKIYFATSQAWDGEMEDRIAQHQQRRGPEWQLAEEPIELPDQLAAMAQKDNCILVDCLTLWLTNLMMAERDIAAASTRLVNVLQQLPDEAAVLLVSNEVGQGIVPMEKMARGFVKPVIDTEIEFGDLETALDRMESRQVFGKIIMRMG